MSNETTDGFMVKLRGRWGDDAVELAGSMLGPWLVSEDEVVKVKALGAMKAMVEELRMEEMRERDDDVTGRGQ